MGDGAAAAPDAAVIASARSGEPDRYLAALLAPPDARSDLLALAAFASELARVPVLVTREPTMGAIRLQWWRDALANPDFGTPTGNPIADAVRAAIRGRDLPAALLLEAIDAREVDLGLRPMTDDAALADYLWSSEGTLFAMAVAVLGDHGGDVRQAAISTGYAYGLARVMLGLPQALSRGHLPLPYSRLDASNVSSRQLLSGEGSADVTGLLERMCAEAREALATSRQHVANLPRRVRVAFLPLALVETYLRTLERPGRDLMRSPAEIAPLTRVWRIAAAHWLGRI